jgi:hypothetical protein
VPDKVDAAIAGANQPPPLANYQMLLGPNRPAMVVFPADIAPAEALAFIDGFLHVLSQHRERMAAMDPMSRLVLRT